MILLVNSPVRQSGVSTLTESIAFTYSNWINRPALIVSIASDNFYKSKCQVSEDYQSKFLSIVNGNTGGYGDLKVYTYKVNDLLYYYQAHSSPAASERQHEADLLTFLARASREFGMVIVDLDDKVNSFQKYLDLADACFTILPPDKMVMKDARVGIAKVLEDYKERGGLAVKTKMMYIINKLDAEVTTAAAAKLLGAPKRDVYSLPYEPRFIKNGNANMLLHFLGDTLLYKKTSKDKVLEVRFKRLYNTLRKL